jgi:phosphopantetheine adenylyltransferase
MRRNNKMKTNIDNITFFHPVYAKKVLDMVENFNFDDNIEFPVIFVEGKTILMDGHHRLLALAIKKSGINFKELTIDYLEKENLLYLDIIPNIQINIYDVKSEILENIKIELNDVLDIIENNYDSELYMMIFENGGGFYDGGERLPIYDGDGICFITNDEEFVIKQKLAITDKFSELKNKDEFINNFKNTHKDLIDLIKRETLFSRIVVLESPYYNYTNPAVWYEIDFESQTIIENTGVDYYKIEYKENIPFYKIDDILKKNLRRNTKIKVGGDTLFIENT